MSDNNRLVLKESSDQSANNDASQSQQNRDQPRQPRNMEDLLRYAIEAESLGGQHEVHQNDIGPLDPQRREFLENVISSMSVDLLKELKDLISVLQVDYHVGDDTKHYEKAFEHILDLTDNIDLANDFFKLGGFEVCKNWITKGPSEVRWRAAGVIGECSQNNPFCQEKAIETGLLKILMDLAQNDSNEMVRLKSFHAVSCIIRNNENTLLNFLSLNGHKLILNCLKSSSNRLKTKALFCTTAITNKEGMLRDQLWDIGLVNEIVDLIIKCEDTKLIEDVSCMEQSLSALLCLTKDTNKKIKNSEAFINKLLQLQQTLSQQPAFMESVEHIKSIIKVIAPLNHIHI